MTRVLIPREIWTRLRGYDSLRKGAAEFVKCCEKGRAPPRIYKQSGIARDGSVFQPYLRLALWHHHLHRDGEPLLVTQHVGDAIVAVALPSHRTYLTGDKWLWMQQHAQAIDWALCEDIRKEVSAYVPPPSSR